MTLVLLISAGVLLTVLTALIWALRRRIAVVTVVGESMLPTFAAGDRVMVRRAGLGEIRPGVVVVVEKPAVSGIWITPPPRWPAGRREWMIKRVAAVPGDRRPDLSLPAAGQRPSGPTMRAAPDDLVVPRGKLVMLGDNPARSYDSRQLGYFPAERLLGVVQRPLAKRAGSPPRRIGDAGQ